MHSSPGASSVGSLRRHTTLGGVSNHMPRLAQIQEESKYSKARHQRARRVLLISLLMFLALTGVYHIILAVVRLTFSIGSASSSLTNPISATFPPASLRRTKPDDYYFQAHHAYHQHLQQQHQQEDQQQHQLSRQERIDQAIQNLKEYQADKDAREAEFREEVKAQIEQELQQEQQQLEQDAPLRDGV